MKFGEAVSATFNQTFTIKGRSSRSQYWYFILACTLIEIPVFMSGFMMDILVPTLPAKGLISLLLILLTFLALFIPSITLAIRRLHDTNHSGFWLLIPYGIILLGIIVSKAAQNPVASVPFSLLSFVFSLYLMYLYCKKGDAGPNRFGDPAV